MIHAIKTLAALPFAILLASCLSKDPANQCLDSFRSNLKDPDSGKVLDFKDNILTYTATNSYGARIQGKALCKESITEKGKWDRDTSGEYLQILELATKKLEKSNECRKAGGSGAECAGGSRVLERSAISLRPSAPGELEDEAARELGYK